MRPQRTYPHGVTSWITRAGPDIDAARTFYAGLFGWTFTDAPGDAAVATLDGQEVAALAPGGGDGATWLTHVAVDDADATAAAVPGLGGTLVVGPLDDGGAGRWAECVDPQGGSFRLWQAGSRP